MWIKLPTCVKLGWEGSVACPVPEWTARRAVAERTWQRVGPRLRNCPNEVRANFHVPPSSISSRRCSVGRIPAQT